MVPERTLEDQTYLHYGPKIAAHTRLDRRGCPLTVGLRWIEVLTMQLSKHGVILLTFDPDP